MNGRITHNSWLWKKTPAYTMIIGGEIQSGWDIGY